MTEQSVVNVVAQSFYSGLKQILTSTGGQPVSPSSLLTSDIRHDIHSCTAQLVDWTMAAYDTSSHAIDPSDNPIAWRELIPAYQAHRSDCPTCIAPGTTADTGNTVTLGGGSNPNAQDTTLDLRHDQYTSKF
jgi:hypothetical protein